MPSRYDDKLIAETITCFAEEDGVVMSREQAIEALDALGSIFLALGGEGGTAGGALATPPADPPRLDNPSQL